MSPLARRIAVALTGFCAFLNLYSPQAILPELARELGVGVAGISTIMTVSTLAIALTAPFTGAIADVLGRKRVITAAMLAVALPTVLMAFAPDVQALAVCRFVQGLLLPPIFAVTIAYIGDEWPPSEVAGVAGLYVSGSSIGGFAGRFIPGVLADVIGWRGAFVVLAVLTLACALAVAMILPRERSFVRSQGLAASLRQMLRHLRDPRLVATFGIGFGVLFNFLATFTYVSFHLAAPPYGFSSALLGAIFVTYLAGTVMRADGGTRNYALRSPPLHYHRHRHLGCRRAALAGAASGASSSQALRSARAAGCFARQSPPAMSRSLRGKGAPRRSAST